MKELEPNLIKLIPVNYSGELCDTICCVDEIENNKSSIFKDLKEKLVDINNWNNYAKIGSAKFNLLDSKGRNKKCDPKIGDYIQIIFSKYQKIFMNHYDYVQISEFKSVENNHENYLLIRVKPCCNPKKYNSETTHFFESKASNTFILSLNSNNISFSIHGRNENPNTNVNSNFTRIRNLIFAKLGFIGFSKIQWESFAKGIIDINEKKIQ